MATLKLAAEQEKVRGLARSAVGALGNPRGRGHPSLLTGPKAGNGHRNTP